MIYRLDWEKAWNDGDLDEAILNVIEDDAAINGCRPEFVTLSGRTLLATADYGDIRPEIRLYDPDVLLAAGRSRPPGVVAHRVLCGPFNQNLHWDAESGHLICVQNVIAGRGWRLDELDLARAVADGRADGPGVRVRRLTFAPHDELEGYWRLTDRARPVRRRPPPRQPVHWNPPPDRSGRLSRDVGKSRCGGRGRRNPTGAEAVMGENCRSSEPSRTRPAAKHFPIRIAGFCRRLPRTGRVGYACGPSPIAH